MFCKGLPSEDPITASVCYYTAITRQPQRIHHGANGGNSDIALHSDRTADIVRSCYGYNAFHINDIDRYCNLGSSHPRCIRIPVDR